MARQPPKSRNLPESSLSSDISMNKGEIKGNLLNSGNDPYYFKENLLNSHFLNLA
jgi:hypothetical protein